MYLRADHQNVLDRLADRQEVAVVLQEHGGFGGDLPGKRSVCDCGDVVLDVGVVLVKQPDGKVRPAC